VTTVEWGRRDAQHRPIDRTETKLIIKFFTAFVTSLHGSLLVLWEL